MATQKKYFHDHLVLLLLSVNTFLAIASCILIVVRLSTSHGNGYIVQYRPALGINAFQTGGLGELLSMGAFALMVLLIHGVLSLRAYNINRHLSVVILSLGVLLLLLTIIISNALLALR